MGARLNIALPLAAAAVSAGPGIAGELYAVKMTGRSRGQSYFRMSFGEKFWGRYDVRGRSDELMEVLSLREKRDREDRRLRERNGGRKGGKR